MRLLLTTDAAPGEPELRLTEFYGESVPKYAILSHTWTHNEEVLFSDVQNHTWAHKKGLSKVQGAIRQAKQDGLGYIWIDSACIDKSSSAELSEAINSMFAWYEAAEVCYAFLADVSADNMESTMFHDEFRGSAWWTRGWTLQELIAPAHVQFYSATWTPAGDKSALGPQIQDITGIESAYLDHTRPLQTASIAKRMSWASTRVTTRLEDIAYCLLGIFSVNMPMLYGEGGRAFIRLQEEIIRYSDDHSVFAWTDASITSNSGLLASHPKAFLQSRFVESLTDWEHRKPYSMSNMGLQIDLPCTISTSDDTRKPQECEVTLACRYPGRIHGQLGLRVQQLPGTTGQFARIECSSWVHVRYPGSKLTLFFPQVFVPSPKQTLALLQNDYLVPRSFTMYNWDGKDEEKDNIEVLRWKSAGEPAGERGKVLWSSNASADHMHRGRTLLIPAARSSQWITFTHRNNLIGVFIGRDPRGEIAFAAIEAHDQAQFSSAITNFETLDHVPLRHSGFWIKAGLSLFIKADIRRQSESKATHDLDLTLWKNFHPDEMAFELSVQRTTIILRNMIAQPPYLTRICVPNKKIFNDAQVWHNLATADKSRENTTECEGYSVLTFRTDFNLAVLTFKKLRDEHLFSPPVDKAVIRWCRYDTDETFKFSFVSLHRKDGLRNSDLLRNSPYGRISSSSKHSTNLHLLERSEVPLYPGREQTGDLCDPRRWFAVTEDERDLLTSAAPGIDVTLNRTIRAAPAS